MLKDMIRMLVVYGLVVSVALAEQNRPNVELVEWERGFAVRSLEQRDMAVYLWFYEWNMFEAMLPGQHTRGTFQLQRQLDQQGQHGTIRSDALRLTITATHDGADLKLSVTNRTTYDFPSIAAIIPCFNPGPVQRRNQQLANTDTYFLGADGLQQLVKREIHFNQGLRGLVDAAAQDGKYAWSTKWPQSKSDAVGGLIVRQSTDGRWSTGIAWEDFLSAQGHNPWQCMHLSVRVGPLQPGASKTIRGKIYLLRGDRDDVLRRYRDEFD